jgi:hypothetical protein
MKDLKALVKTYVKNTAYRDALESGSVKVQLRELLNFQERANRNSFYLFKALSKEYGFNDDGGCYSKSQEKLNELCEIEFNKQNKRKLKQK